MPAKSHQQQSKRHGRRGTLAAVAGVASLAGAGARAFTAVRPACTPPMPLASPGSSAGFRGVSIQAAGKSSARTARKAALLGIFDIAKVASDPGTPLLLAQCAGAISLVVAGNYCIQKEETEEEENAQKQNMIKYKQEAQGIVIKEEEEEFDFWRESLARYLGYSNELGEALRPVFPAAYVASYVAAFSYVFADSLDKASRGDKKAKRASIRKLFLSLDLDGDGALDEDELMVAFAEMKIKNPVTPASFKACFERVNVSGNKTIEIEEFMAAYDRADAEITDLVEAWQQQQEGSSNPLDNPSLVGGADALIWQTIASVALPGFTINRFVTLAEQACAGQAAGNPVAEYFPTVLGLCMIPLICKPLDVLADFGLDATLRPLLFSAIDSDKSGTIEFSELKAKMQNVDASFDEAYLRQLFDECDTQKNGVITIEEWRMGGYKKFKQALKLNMIPSATP